MACARAARPLSSLLARAPFSTATTRVDVANIRLERPKPKDPSRWVGLEGLEGRVAGSLIPDTLRQMEAEAGEERRPMDSKAERVRRRRALDGIGVPDFGEFLAKRDVVLERSEPQILQVNIGLYCNQACSHCHVDSSPKRTETMSREVADACLAALRSVKSLRTLDVTGGAPELNQQFRYLVAEAVKLGVDVIDRCNLTVLLEPGQEDLAEFLASHRVRVVASLPCYGPKNVNMQRGSGVFDRSIRGLRKLNEVGYGIEGTGLALDLVYNPLGAFLPPLQAALEAKYKEELMEAFGIHFSSLLTITNMPISRFADFLQRRGELEEYMALLVRSFNPAAVPGLMCRDTINVRWDGALFDCDFNQQLGLGLGARPCATGTAAAGNTTAARSILDPKALADIAGVGIALGRHCFGCTAGQGSGCQGATAA